MCWDPGEVELSAGHRHWACIICASAAGLKSTLSGYLFITNTIEGPQEFLPMWNTSIELLNKTEIKTEKILEFYLLTQFTSI